MKTAAYVCFLWALTASPIWTSPLVAQTNPTGAPSSVTPLTGSTLKTDDLVPTAEFIFTGKVNKSSLGPPTLSGFGLLTLQVDVTQVFKGAMSGQVKLFAFVESSTHEGAPASGGSYIFFVSKDHDFLTVQKLLPAIEDEIEHLKALLHPAA